MNYRLNTRKPNLFSLILLISFPSFIAVVISPALPAIGSYFQISSNYAQQTITFFLFGYSIGQLLYSPFSNRYGRKAAVYSGLIIYFIGCALSLWAIRLMSIDLLLFGRFIMALGSAAGMVLTYTFINDFYYPHQARPVVSYTILSYAFMPSIGVLVGGYLTTKVSWTACFYFFILYGLIIFLAALALPETLIEKNPLATRFKKILVSYFKVIKDVRLLLFSIAFAFIVTLVYITATGAPYIAINCIGISASLYGIIMLLPYAGQLVGAIIAGQLNQRYSAYRVMTVSYTIIALGSSFFLISFALNFVNLYTLLISLFTVMLGVPVLTSNASVLAVSEQSDKSAASGIMSFIVMGSSVLSVFLYSLFPAYSRWLLPLFYVSTLGISFLAFLIAKSKYTDEDVKNG